MREGREDERAGRGGLMGGIITQRKEKGDEVKIIAKNEFFWDNLWISGTYDYFSEDLMTFC